MSSSVTQLTIACQAPLSTGPSRQEYWSGLPFPSPGDLSDPRIKPKSPALQADSLPSDPPGKPLEVWDPELKKDKKQNRDLVTKYEIKVWMISQK